jgi:hypothetical protein
MGLTTFLKSMGFEVLLSDKATGGLGPVLLWRGYFSEEKCRQVVSSASFIGSAGVGCQGLHAEDLKVSIEPTLRDGTLLGWPQGEPALEDELRSTIETANRAYFRYSLESRAALEVSIADYGPGHHFDWHFDFLEGGGLGRKITSIVQLSPGSEYEGGELQFKERGGNVALAPREQGSLMIFGAMALHRAAPVLNGNRKSLVAWMHGIV